jgi:hypothetical protein
LTLKAQRKLTKKRRLAGGAHLDGGKHFIILKKPPTPFKEWVEKCLFRISKALRRQDKR